MSPVFRHAAGLLLPFVLASGAYAAPTGLLNDTGQGTCSDGSITLATCTDANSGDAAAYPRQDGRFGRDAAAGAGTLTKTGAGAKGFDYTKVCFNGDPEGSGTCTGTLVSNLSATATGSPTTDWACTKDNVTNLVWSLENGYVYWDDAIAPLPNATNAAGRCGYSTGWRLPTRRELLSIVHRGASHPAIDSTYFPGTQNAYYWSLDTYAIHPATAWYVNFDDGNASYVNKSINRYFARLVHDGQ